LRSQPARSSKIAALGLVLVDPGGRLTNLRADQRRRRARPIEQLFQLFVLEA